MNIKLSPIAFVRNSKKEMEDDHWGEIVSEIVLTEDYNAETLLGINEFSHVEIVYYFDKVRTSDINYTARHPRNNKKWPLTGIFAQRGKDRPNQIGLCIAQVISHKGNVLTVKGLDALNNTPVLDIKPVMSGFLPREKVIQPLWATELMKNYW